MFTVTGCLVAAAAGDSATARGSGLVISHPPDSVVIRVANNPVAKGRPKLALQVASPRLRHPRAVPLWGDEPADIMAALPQWIRGDVHVVFVSVDKSLVTAMEDVLRVRGVGMFTSTRSRVTRVTGNKALMAALDAPCPELVDFFRRQWTRKACERVWSEMRVSAFWPFLKDEDAVARPGSEQDGFPDVRILLDSAIRHYEQRKSESGSGRRLPSVPAAPQAPSAAPAGVSAQLRATPIVGSGDVDMVRVKDILERSISDQLSSKAKEKVRVKVNVTMDDNGSCTPGSRSRSGGRAAESAGTPAASSVNSAAASISSGPGATSTPRTMKTKTHAGSSKGPAPSAPAAEAPAVAPEVPSDASFPADAKDALQILRAPSVAALIEECQRIGAITGPRRRALRNAYFRTSSRMVLRGQVTPEFVWKGASLLVRAGTMTEVFALKHWRHFRQNWTRAAILGGGPTLEEVDDRLEGLKAATDSAQAQPTPKKRPAPTTPSTTPSVEPPAPKKSSSVTFATPRQVKKTKAGQAAPQVRASSQAAAPQALVKFSDPKWRGVDLRVALHQRQVQRAAAETSAAPTTMAASSADRRAVGPTPSAVPAEGFGEDFDWEAPFTFQRVTKIPAPSTPLITEVDAAEEAALLGSGDDDQVDRMEVDESLLLRSPEAKEKEAAPTPVDDAVFFVDRWRRSAFTIFTEGVLRSTSYLDSMSAVSQRMVEAELKDRSAGSDHRPYFRQRTGRDWMEFDADQRAELGVALDTERFIVNQIIWYDAMTREKKAPGTQGLPASPRKTTTAAAAAEAGATVGSAETAVKAVAGAAAAKSADAEEVVVVQTVTVQPSVSWDPRLPLKPMPGALEALAAKQEAAAAAAEEERKEAERKRRRERRERESSEEEED